MIIHTRIEPNSRGSRGSFWIAHVTIPPSVGGRTFTARSQHGAPNELARLLVSAGIPDQPVEVFNRDRSMVTLRYPSLHEMDKWTYTETASQPLHRIRWKPVSDNLAAKHGENDENPGEPSQGDCG